jgi:RNA polymerase sigma factor (TIGR02999 family)
VNRLIERLILALPPTNLELMSEVTRILNAIDHGDPQAAEQLLPLVYDELRKLAAHKMTQEKPGQTLDATGLVHEAYVRLVGADASPRWNSRGHFFAAAAEAMRRILIEAARRKGSEKHGGGWLRQEFLAADLAVESTAEDLLTVDEALAKLAQDKPQIAKVVELRFFAGLTLEEIAATLGISHRSAHRHWAYARAWLRRELDGRVEGSS